MRVSTVDAPTAGHALTEKENSIFVNPQRRFQALLGIGGAITDSSAETFAKLPKQAQRQLLTAYYDPDKGIGYTLARTTIHSSDFSSGSYTYIKEGDAALKTFRCSTMRNTAFRCCAKPLLRPVARSPRLPARGARRPS